MVTYYNETTAANALFFLSVSTELPHKSVLTDTCSAPRGRTGCFLLASLAHPAILVQSNAWRCLMFFGVLLIIMGVLMLSDQLGLLHGDMWDYFWPTVIIAIGISMIFKHKRPRKL
jgi:hypothetical protein